MRTTPKRAPKRPRALDPVVINAPAVEGPIVEVKDWVLVRMPPEEGKPSDRYAVVEVKGTALVASGVVIEEGSQLVYARKRVAIEVAKDAEARQRAPRVVA